MTTDVVIDASAAVEKVTRTTTGAQLKLLPPHAVEACSHLAFLREHGVSAYAFAPWSRSKGCRSSACGSASPHVELLKPNLNLDLYSRNPSPVFSLDSVDLVDGVGTLLMAELDGQPVGCGAFRVMDDMPGSAEIKRMYVTLAGRSKKIGAAILAELERVAEAIGVRRFALEAGLRQPEAKQL